MAFLPCSFARKDLVSLGLFLVSLWILFFLLPTLAGRWLAPWDAYPIGSRPPPTDFARRANDWFEVGFGAYLLHVPFVALVGGSVFQIKRFVAPAVALERSMFLNFAYLGFVALGLIAIPSSLGRSFLAIAFYAESFLLLLVSQIFPGFLQRIRSLRLVSS